MLKIFENDSNYLLSFELNIGKKYHEKNILNNINLLLLKLFT